MVEPIIVYPTDTVWGIGCKMSSFEGHKRIASIKKCGIDKPVSLLFGSSSQLQDYVLFDQIIDIDNLEHLSKLEITFGFPRSLFKKTIPQWITGDSPLVGVRLVLELKSTCDYILSIGEPIITTSLNIHGEPPIFSIAEAEKFADEHLVTDYLFISEQIKCSGSSSTFIDFSNNTIKVIRRGRFCDDIERYLSSIAT